VGGVSGEEGQGAVLRGGWGAQPAEYPGNSCAWVGTPGAGEETAACARACFGSTARRKAG